jgi:hypothetical protein
MVGADLLRRGVGMVTVIAGGPDYDLGELRRWLAWRDEKTT